MTLPKSAASTRIDTIDILRGFALFGIIIIHTVEQFYGGALPEGVSTPTVTGHVLHWFIRYFIMGKFFMIFSFLFGLSFYLQSSKSGPGFLARFAWRLLLLGGIGMIHHMHYRGDILTIYTMLGFSMLVFNRLPDRALLIFGILLTLNIPTVLLRSYSFIASYGITSAINGNGGGSVAPVINQYFETLKHGSYFEILMANLREFPGKMVFQIWSGRIFITVGLFLLGVYAGRKQFFRNIELHVPLLQKAVRYSLVAALICAVVAGLFFIGAPLLDIQFSASTNKLVSGILLDFYNAPMALLYLSGIILLTRKPSTQKILYHFYPVGRMGLTTYLMQTMFGTLIFFSYGLGMLGELDAIFRLLIAFALFFTQIVFATTWFKYFQFGPVEWLWRSLTYFKIQPMVKQVPTVA